MSYFFKKIIVFGVFMKQWILNVKLKLIRKIAQRNYLKK